MLLLISLTPKDPQIQAFLYQKDTEYHLRTTVRLMAFCEALQVLNYLRRHFAPKGLPNFRYQTNTGFHIRL